MHTLASSVVPQSGQVAAGINTRLDEVSICWLIKKMDRSLSVERVTVYRNAHESIPQEG